MSWEMRTAGVMGEDEKSLHKYTIIDTTVTSSQMEPRRSLVSSTPRQWYKPITRDCSNDKWLGQILAILFSLCCSVAIITILSVYDQGPVPASPGSITLNAVISVLATASKGALLYTISSCLGQLKWSWLKTDSFRTLSDLELFDSASRGPLGAVALICRMRKGPTVMLGALLTLVAFGVDPFVQQVLVFESAAVYRPSVDVVAPQVRLYLLDADSDLALSAIYAGIWGSEFTMKPACTSGNCTFDPFESVGWCSKCYEDVSWAFQEDCSLTFDPHQFLNASGGIVWDFVVNRTCILTSQSGRFLEVFVTAEVSASEQDEDSPQVIDSIQITVPYQYTRIVYDLSEDIGFDNISLETAPLGRWAFIHFKVSDWSLKVDTTMLCDLDFCLRNESVAVTAGVPTANILSTNYGKRYTQNFTIPNDTNQTVELLCWDPKDTASDSFKAYMGPDGYWDMVAYSSATFAWCHINYSAEFAWASAIDTILESTLARSFEVSPNANLQGNPATVVYNGTFMSSELDSDVWVINEYDVGDDLTGQSLLISRRIGAEKMMENIALSLTRLGEAYGNTTLIEGKLGSTVTLVTVRWTWLILPALVVIGTTLLLILTMFTTYRTRTPVWKLSTNALLFHGLEHDAEHAEDAERLGTISEMDKKARLTQVRLVKSDKTGRLYLKAQ